MNISSNGSYPSNKLSNFSGNRFIIDGVQCNSMEGFLQSLKFKNPEIQKEICKLVGIGAKRRGGSKNWKKYQILYWQNVEYPRKSEEYQKLLDKAYTCLFEQNEGFRKALKDSGNSVLTHTIGKNNQSDTVLTVSEFCGRLMKLRELL